MARRPVLETRDGLWVLECAEIRFQKKSLCAPGNRQGDSNAGPILSASSRGCYRSTVREASNHRREKGEALRYSFAISQSRQRPAQHESPMPTTPLAPRTAAETRQTTALGVDVPIRLRRHIEASRRLIRISPVLHEGALSSPVASTMAASERRGGPAASRRRAFST